MNSLSIHPSVIRFFPVCLLWACFSLDYLSFRLFPCLCCVSVFISVLFLSIFHFVPLVVFVNPLFVSCLLFSSYFLFSIVFRISIILLLHMHKNFQAHNPHTYSSGSILHLLILMLICPAFLGFYKEAITTKRICQTKA